MNPLLALQPDRSDGWLQPLRDWPLAVIRELQSQTTVARIVVASVRGSAPREPGTCMLVDSTQTLGTIGGGRLEWEAVQAARALLTRSDNAAASVSRFVLGTELAQCCGGVVELWIERYTRADLPLLNEVARAVKSGNANLHSEIQDGQVSRRVIREFSRAHGRTLFRREADGRALLHEPLPMHLPMLYLYGAGHVGQALARVLSNVAMRVRWIDSRAGMLPPVPGELIEAICTGDPATTVSDAPSHAHFLVMTHSHALDYSLCRAILARSNVAFVGLIGSKSKAARFRSRLARDGLSVAAIDRLTCPIGIDGIDSKAPAAIAIAVAAQLLQVVETGNQAAKTLSLAPVADCDGDCTSCGRPET